MREKSGFITLVDNRIGRVNVRESRETRDERRETRERERRERERERDESDEREETTTTMTTHVVQPIKMNCKNLDDVLFALKLRKPFIINPMSQLTICRSYSLSISHS